MLIKMDQYRSGIYQETWGKKWARIILKV
jgi:hypothetical protein